MTSWVVAVKMISLVTLWCTLNLKAGCALLLFLLVVSGPEMCVVEGRRNTALGFSGSPPRGSSLSTEEMSCLEQKTRPALGVSLTWRKTGRELGECRHKSPVQESSPPLGESGTDS